MADNDVKIKVSLDGDKVVIQGLEGIGDGASKADSKLGGLVKNGLKGAGAALVGFTTAAVAAGGALTASVVSAYADYEQNIGGIETMFGESAGMMKKYADDAYKTAGLSANDYMSQVTSFSAALLQGLGGDTAKAGEVANTAMIDMSDNANKFGSNISDIQNAYQGFAKQNYTMLDNLKLGYGGTQAEMARLINDSGVLGDTMEVTAANVNEVSFDKIIEAINTVQTEMGITGTTALEAEQTISGSIGMLQGSFANLLTGLGSADADVATLAGNVISSFESVVTNITPVIENLGNNIQTLGPQLGGMMESLVGAISSAIPAILDAGVALIGGLITGISSALPGLIEAAVPAITGLVGMIATSLPMLVDAGMKAVVALGEGLAQAVPSLLPQVAFMITGIVDGIVTNLPALLGVALQLIMAFATGIVNSIPVLVSYLPELIHQIVNFIITGIPVMISTGIELLTSLVTALPEIITMIVEVLPQIITAVIDAVIGAIPLLIDAGIQLFISLVEALPTIINTVVGAIPQIITGVLGAITGAIPKLVMAGVQLLVALVRNLPQIIGTVVGAIPQIIGGILGAIGGSVGAIAGAGGDLVRGLWRGISDATGWLLGKISGFVDRVMGGIKDFFGIKSPSRRMAAEVGDYLPSGVGLGVEQSEDDAIKPIQHMNERVMQEARKLPSLAMDHTFKSTMMVTPQLASTQATSTPNYAMAPGTQGFTVQGPLVSVDSMTVRNDQDIRNLSTQLRTDMTRELRAQGVLE